MVSSTAKNVRLTAWADGTTDTRGYLYNDKGGELTNDDDNGPGRNFQVTRTVSPGTYYVKVVGYQATTTGTYTFSVDDHGDSSGSATTLTGNTSGEIGVAGNVDYFHFNVTSAGSLILESTGDTDTFGQLHNSRGDSINANDDDGSDGNNFKIEHQVTTGDYYLRVTGYDDKTGSYDLTVGGTANLGSASSGNTGTGPNNSNNTRQTAHYMELGHVASDGIVSGDQQDWFAVRVRRSVATTGTVRLTAWTVGSVKVAMFLKNDLNENLVSVIPGGSAPGPVQAVYANTPTGKYYYIMVRGRRTSDRGSYQIKVDDHGDSRTTATAVTLGDTDVGGLVAAGNVDYFKFSVANNDTNVTIYTTGDVDTYGELRNSSGGLIESNDDESKTLKNFKIERIQAGNTDKRLDTGTYYVSVSSRTGSTGEYTLNITT